ncbi:hypothetical protein CVE24_17840, partial [Pseudomonas syringae pv. actinidiae]|nr:hypothetical protein [Pseudomonas syringae pv. actinidiae]
MSVGCVYGSSHLFASRRPALRDQSRQSPRSVSGPTSSGRDKKRFDYQLSCDAPRRMPFWTLC